MAGKLGISFLDRIPNVARQWMRQAQDRKGGRAKEETYIVSDGWKKGDNDDDTERRNSTTNQGRRCG